MLAVLSNPATTSGNRTRARVELAREILEYESYAIVNMFSGATYRTGEIAQIGQSPAHWLQARDAIKEGLAEADCVLLAYGISEPTGPARAHHRSQVEWLHHELSTRSLPVCTLSGQPRHPSRWHRYTHANFPGLDLKSALRASFEFRVPADMYL